MRYLLVLCSLALTCTLYSQLSEDVSLQISESIQAQDLKSYLDILASNDFEGRETGTPGNTKAARFIAEKFEKFGIPPIVEGTSYFQEVAFSQVLWNETELSIEGQEKTHLKDFLCLPQHSPGDKLNLDISDLTFLGYGIDDKKYSDYQGKNLQGQTILIYRGEPFDKNGNSLITGSPSPSIWSEDLEIKLEAAKNHGIKTVIIIEDKLREKVGQNRRLMFGGMVLMGDGKSIGSKSVHHCMISPALAETLIGNKQKKVIKAREKIKRKGKSKALSIPVTFKLDLEREVKTLAGQNVLGYIEGIDPELKNEVVVVTAHYDHLGKRGDDIFNGADDNGSGTSAVLEIAQAFVEAKKLGVGPKRSVLCMLVTGEEKGLLGSQYYSEKPVFPLENTVANVNIDMIGRMDDKHTNPEYVYVIGSDRMSSELHEINESVNKKYTQLDLDYTYNAEDDPNRFYYRSDHYNFAKKGVPAIFYFSGTHKDYHRPSDTADKIMFEKTAKIAKLAFHTSWELANRDKRIEVDVR